MSGTVEPDAIDMDVSLNDISLSRMLPGRGADGKVNMRGHVSGTMEDPVFEGTISSRQISVGGTAIYMASAGIYYQNHVVSLDDSVFNQKNGHFEWRGSYHMDSHILQGFLRFKEWNIKEAMRLSSCLSRRWMALSMAACRSEGRWRTPASTSKQISWEDIWGIRLSVRE